MRLILLFLFLCVTYLSGQTYLHGTAGIRNERVTHCVESTCSGTYLDNGGAAGNYSNSIAGGLYRVFCPSTVGSCMRVTFNSFDTELCFPFSCDFLTVGNGATQNSPIIATLQGTPAVPITYTANNPSGCLTFRFTSNSSVARPGWSATLSCVPCATVGNGPNLTDNNDCSRATRLCSGVTYNSNSRGPGLVAEGCVPNSCPAGGENHSNWYTFTVATSGTLTMLIDPQTNTDDYDFAIWGPNVTCNSLGSPLRCSDSGGTGNTGLNTTATDNIEDVTGDKFLSQMNVVAGQTYIMVVDEWLSNTGNGYDLSFGGTATLDCAILPIKLIYFGADYLSSAKGASITFGANVDYLDEYFVIEKSLDGIEYDSIGMMYPTQIGRNDFQYTDETPVYNGFTYYRLKMVEADYSHYSDVSAIAVDDYTNKIILHPNPFNDYIKVQNFGDYYGPCEVRIYNTMGTEVISQSFQFGIINKQEINTKDLSPGIYNAVIKTNGNTETYKIIK